MDRSPGHLFRTLKISPRGPKSVTCGWDLENFGWRTEVRDISAWWTEVRDTKITQTARISTPVVRSAKFFHRTTHHDRRQLSDPPHRARHARYGNDGAQRTRTEVQATTETARVSERVVRFAKFSHRTTPRDRRQLSSRPRGARHARFDHGGAQRSWTEVRDICFGLGKFRLEDRSP